MRRPNRIDAQLRRPGCLTLAEPPTLAARRYHAAIGPRWAAAAVASGWAAVRLAATGSEPFEARPVIQILGEVSFFAAERIVCDREVVGLSKAACLPALVGARDPEIRLVAGLGAMNRREVPQQDVGWKYHVVDAVLLESDQDQDPELSLTSLDPAAIELPPTASSKMGLKRRLHVRDQEIARELHLQRDRTRSLGVRDEEIYAGVA